MSFTGPDLGAVFSDQGTRNRLIRAMMGSDPSAQMDPAPEHRIADDLPGYQNPSPGSTEDLESRASTGRQSLARQLQQQQQPSQPSRLDQLQTQYNAMQPPQAQQLPFRKRLSAALLEGLGNPAGREMLSRNQQSNEFEEGRYDKQRASLAQQIEDERRMQEQEQLQGERDTSAYERELAQQRMADTRQSNLFKQQNALEDQREATRQSLAKQVQEESDKRQSAQFAESEKRQSAQFGEQEKLQGMRDAAADRRAQRTTDRADTSLREKAITYWQPSLDSAERVNVMSKNYEDAVANHDQQAMLSVLAKHLGMTMGLQKGARLNQAIISEAQKSQPWLQGMQAKFDKDGYLSGVTLAPQQMKQMLDLGFERYREDVKKSRSMANYIGATDEPPRQISDEAIGYYLDAAGGDKNRARSMAKQDGWTF